jgi:hypothetical protein
MLLSILLILTLTLIGCIFHVYFSLGLAMLVGSIVFNYQDSVLMSVIGFILSFSAMTFMKMYVGKNLWDGLIDFDKTLEA